MASRRRRSDCKTWSLGRPRSRKIEKAVQEALSQGRCWVQFGEDGGDCCGQWWAGVDPAQVRP